MAKDLLRLRLCQWQRQLIIRALAEARLKANQTSKNQIDQIVEHLGWIPQKFSAADLRTSAEVLFPVQAALQCQLNSTPVPSPAFSRTLKQAKRAESLRYHLLSRAAWLESRQVS